MTGDHPANRTTIPYSERGQEYGFVVNYFFWDNSNKISADVTWVRDHSGVNSTSADRRNPTKGVVVEDGVMFQLGGSSAILIGAPAFDRLITVDRGARASMRAPGIRPSSSRATGRPQEVCKRASTDWRLRVLCPSGSLATWEFRNRRRDRGHFRATKEATPMLRTRIFESARSRVISTLAAVAGGAALAGCSSSGSCCRTRCCAPPTVPAAAGQMSCGAGPGSAEERWRRPRRSPPVRWRAARGSAGSSAADRPN